jgi:hypothetical protein
VTANIADALRPLAQPVDTLSLLDGNPRKGDVEAVARSYERFGQRKPIVALPDGTVIAGNHQLLAARKLGWDEIAVVFVDDDEQTAKAFALADNRTSDLGTYDNDALAALLQDVAVDPELLFDTGYDEQYLEALLSPVDLGTTNSIGSDGNVYTDKVAIPQYEIVGEQPAVSDLFDDDKMRMLHAAIDRAGLPDELAAFLRVAAYRHVVFNYRKIAEFYPHQTAEVQRLMEDSALVIIDFDDAIAAGYVRLKSMLERLEAEDNDD